jgi:hypothetical protein
MSFGITILQQTSNETLLVNRRIGLLMAKRSSPVASSALARESRHMPGTTGHVHVHVHFTYFLSFKSSFATTYVKKDSRKFWESRRWGSQGLRESG